MSLLIIKGSADSNKQVISRKRCSFYLPLNCSLFWQPCEHASDMLAYYFTIILNHIHHLPLSIVMESVIRKVQSMPHLLKKDHRPSLSLVQCPTPPELVKNSNRLSFSKIKCQVNTLDELVDAMLAESTDNTVIVFLRNKFPDDDLHHPPNSICCVRPFSR